MKILKKILLFLLLAGWLPSSGSADQAPPQKALVGLSGWVIFSDEDNASLADFERHASQVDRVYFDWYHCGEDGLPEPNPEATEELKARALKAAREGQCQPWMMVTNWRSGFNTPFDRDRVLKFLNNGDLTKNHVEALISFAKKDGVEGIQINYQDLGDQKRRFRSFMEKLSEACKKNGLSLGVAVFGKNRRLDDSTPNAVDYKSLGRVVQEIVRMPQQLGYGRGPQDPPGYLDSRVDMEVALRYMAKAVSPAKVEVEAPVFGYDWMGVQGEPLSWKGLQGILKDNHLLPSRDEYSQELTFTYPGGHEVWYADGKSFEFMADLAKKYKTYGVCLWYFGGEGPDFWETLKRVQATPKGTAGTAPSLVKTAPMKRPRVRPADIFTDKKRGYFFYVRDSDPNAPSDPHSYRPGLDFGPQPTTTTEPESNVSVAEKDGKFWADYTLKGDTASKGAILIGHMDLSPYLDRGALQFFIRGNRGGEDLKIGFTTTPGLTEDDGYELEDGVLLSNYVQVTTDWKLATIPLSDFPERVSYSDAEINEHYSLPFNWNRIYEFTLFNNPVGDAFIEFQISNVRVVPKYDPKKVYRK